MQARKKRGSFEDASTSLNAPRDGGSRRKGKISSCALSVDTLLQRFWSRFKEERGQGTTEYAILVGVLVLIAIVAVIAFKDKISELWNSIAEGINSL